MELNKIIALMHYEKDFKHINQLFKTLNLRVDEVNGELIINDLNGSKISTIKSKKHHGSTIMVGNGYSPVVNDYMLEASFEYNGNKINYSAELDDYGRHQKTTIKVEREKNVFSINISNPLFSELLMKIQHKEFIHSYNHINISGHNLNIAKSLQKSDTTNIRANFRFMDVQFSKEEISTDWIIPFQYHQQNDFFYKELCFLYHTDDIDKYSFFVISSISNKQDSETDTKELFDYCANQAIASDITQKFIDEVFGDFEQVFIDIKNVVRNLISGFNDIFVLIQENSGENRNEVINQYISTFGENQVPLFELKNLEAPILKRI